MLFAEKKFRIATPLIINTLALCYILFGVKFITPSFEEDFCKWKLIMFSSQTFTKDIHHLNDLVFWQDVLQFLYARNVNIAWFSIFLVILSSASFIIIINVYISLAAKIKLDFLISFSLFLFIATSYNSNILWLHHNRVSFIMCSAALAVRFYTLIYYGIKQYKTKALVIFSFIWFVGGLCIRPEAAIATLILFIIMFFFYLNFSVYKTLKAVWGYGVFVLFFIAAYWHNISNSNEFYYSLEPNVEYEIVDRRNVIALSEMKNAIDSARYKAVAEQWMLADVKQTPPAFIKSLICKKGCKDNCNKSTISSFFPVLNSNQFEFLIAENSYVLLLLIFLPIFSLRKTKLAIPIVLMGLVLISLSFSVNVLMRVVQPMLFVLCLITLLLTMAKGVFANLNNRPFILLLLFTSGTTLLYSEIRMNIGKGGYIKKTHGEVQAKVDEILSRYPLRKTVVIMNDYTPFNTGTFLPFTGFNGKKIIITEFGQFSGNAAFLNANGKMSNCASNDFRCKMEYLNNHKTDLILIGKRQRLDFYSYYLKAVYGMDWYMTNGHSEHLYEETFFWIPESYNRQP